MEQRRPSALYSKAQEIQSTLKTICALIPEENEMLQSIKGNLLEDITIILAKIYSAERSKLWDMKMENAVIIRKSARALYVQYHNLSAFGFGEAHYYKIVRLQIEEFRLLFREWVAAFNPKHFITDEWGLLNPPGIPQDYEQRSDELDFLDEEDE